MSEEKNPQDLTPTFLRKLPDGKAEELDGNGKPTKAPDADQPPKPQTEDDRTVVELKAALDAAKVEYPSTAKRDDLVKLAAEKGV